MATKADGTVRISRGEDERIHLTASAPDRLVTERTNVRGTSVTLRLAPGVPRSIEVRAADASPVPGALVTTEDGDHPLGFCDDQGAMRIPLAKGGSLRVAARTEDGRVARAGVIPASAASAAPRRIVLPSLVAVTGRILDAETRRPIVGAIVWRASDPSRGIPTDSAGSYSLAAVDGSSVEVTAGATGYLRPEAITARASAADPSGPSLALQPAAAIEGTVVDGTGAPVAGAKLTLDQRRAEGVLMFRMGGPSSEASAVSSSRGRFRLGPIDSGAMYDLTARAKGFAPGTKEVAGLEARKTLRGMRVELDPGQAVVGHLVDEQGNSIAGADASLRPAAKGRGAGGLMMEGIGGGADRERALADDDGRFRIVGLRPGAYELALARKGFARKTIPGVDVKTSEGPVDLGDIVLEPGERVAGRVIDPQGRPIDGVEVTVQQGDLRMPFVMRGMGATGRPPDAVTGTDGMFLLEDRQKGEAIELSLSRSGYGAARQPGVKVPPEMPIEITMQPASKVSGAVLDQDRKPLPGATVTLRRSQTGGIGGAVIKMMMQDDATVDDQGRFLFEDIEPGTISLSAVAPGRREAKRDSIEVPAGEDLAGVDLTLPPGAVITGRVLAPDGRAAIGVEVGVVDEGQAEMARMRGPVSDGEGRFRIEGVEPGAVSIEATHPDYVRTVKDIDARAGINVVNLELGGGNEVSGSVLDPEGAPIAGAWVCLGPKGRAWGGADTTSAADGSFHLKGATDGNYSLSAGKQGYATSRGDIPVHVEGAPVGDVTVRLEHGGTVVGRVTGISPEQMSSVAIRAGRERGSFGFQAVTPDREGAYRLENLSAGTWNVVASLEATGQQARGEVTLASGAPETRLDLEFSKGLSLTGRAVHGGSAVSGAALYVEGTNVDHSGWSRTGADGSFTVGGLVRGTYRVELRQWETGLGHTETVEITSDRDIVLEIPTARVDGRVLDTGDRQPLAGATVTLAPSEGSTSRFGHFGERAATTDQDGHFRVSDLADGAWRLTASRKGYATRVMHVTVRSGRGPDDVRVELDPTEGLTLQVKLPDGRIPPEVAVAVMDPGGRPVTRGSFATGENGRVRLSSVSSGTWDVIVGATGTGTVGIRAMAPGEPVAVALPPACTLRFDVPDLVASGAPAKATIQDSSGRPFLGLNWFGEPVAEWRVDRGHLEIDDLPPGAWTVQVTTADGQSWRGQAATAPGTPASVAFE